MEMSVRLETTLHSLRVLACGRHSSPSIERPRASKNFSGRACFGVRDFNRFVLSLLSFTREPIMLPNYFYDQKGSLTASLPRVCQKPKTQ